MKDDMICVSEQAIREKARTMPIAYLAECKAVMTLGTNGQWCFEPKTYAELSDKYDRYLLSEADPYRLRISGCCDRADQY